MSISLFLLPSEVCMGRDSDAWESKAVCANSELNWFSTNPTEKYECRAICQSECPVRKQCISAALAEEHIYGIWGGVDDYELRRARSVDSKGKPATRARPPRCPFCQSKDLTISGTRVARGFHTRCNGCDLAWYMATIPAKLKKKRAA